MDASSSTTHQTPHLELLDRNGQYDFREPQKMINEGEDVQFFLTSKAYGDILAWILQLNASMFPRKSNDGSRIQTWEIGSSSVTATPSVQEIATLLKQLDSAIEEAPPDPGPRRFGNISFRKWYRLVEERMDGLLGTCLESADSPLVAKDARKELKSYLLGSFGSVQRLDYGTGHELSFLAFLGGLWKLGFFEDSVDGGQERSIVLHAVEPYLELVRKLILTYNLEPAGSHGVWGLDDHAFAPYIFGSAQFGPAISDITHMPQEGSLAEAPDPGGVAAIKVVERERRINMYFSAIGFIYDVKKGPFWEHSPMLFDISGVKAGWAKINKGMIKMYIAEVLSKFPVVQHFPFGQLFEWQRDPDAVLPAASTHVQAVSKSRVGQVAEPPDAPGVGVDAPTAAPWSQNARAGGRNPTAAPWARVPHVMTQQQQQQQSRHRPGDGPDGQESVPGTVMTKAAGGSNVAVTKAPWAK